MQYAYESEHWQALASIYNGKGYNRVLGHHNVFRFCPVTDGLFLTCQGAYMNGGSYYCIGGCFHTIGTSGALWSYAEQRITDGLSLIAGYSHAFGPEVQCLYFAGLGGRYIFRKAEFGLFTDYARFRYNFEWATELTCNLRFNDHVSLQPALHIIVQKDMKAVVGLCRIVLKI